MATDTPITYKDLRSYIDAVDRLGELRRVDGADWDLEFGAITEVAARATNPKVVLFDHIKGYPKGFSRRDQSRLFGGDYWSRFRA